MQFKYMRIQGRENSPITKHPKGIFGIFEQMIQDKKINKKDQKIFKETDDWFKEHLPEPEQCINGEKVITFFKTKNTDEMQDMIAPALQLLDKYMCPYDVVYTNFVGTIVYEDDWQVAVRVEDGKMI